MNRNNLHTPTRPLGLDPVAAGTVCCIISALGYTATSICMRRLSEFKCDPLWVIFNKEAVTVIVVGPWLLYRAFRGMRVLPPWRTMALLMLIGLTVQLGANVGVQWTLGVKGMGLAVTIPSIFGIMLIACAILGRVFLGERVSWRSTFAIGLLLVSLAMLALGAGAASESITAVAVATACLAGAIYAMLSTTIRHTVTRGTPAGTIVFVTTLMGVLSLGPLSFYRLGMPHLLSTPPEQLAWMAAAGTLNLIGFLAITKGLELTTVVHANVLNASQVAMASLAGLLLFHERLTPWLIAGVSLTIVGVMFIDRPDRTDWHADQHA